MGWFEKVVLIIENEKLAILQLEEKFKIILYLEQLFEIILHLDFTPNICVYILTLVISCF